MSKPRRWVRCPTPWKRAHRGRRQALHALHVLQGLHEADRQKPCRVYRCSCGRWHLTSKAETW